MAIYKNDFDQTVIQLGSGDIEVANGRTFDKDETEMYPCVIFVETDPGEIGRQIHPEKEGQPAEIRKDPGLINMVFTDPKSIEVVIDNLMGAKKRFELNGTKKMTMQEITDEV